MIFLIVIYRMSGVVANIALLSTSSSCWAS